MIKDKIKNPQALKKIIARLNKRKRVGFTNGCFDILHFGHVQYLEEAKKHCDILIVAVNSDDSVKRLKGRKRPIIPLLDRMRLVASLESVDYVTYFKEDTPAKIVSYLKPRIIIKGADYKLDDIAGKDIVESYGGTVKNVKYHKGHSVTSIINRIISRYRR
jgi:D-beta-D-heptose 7-phosphate kinase/D-beta-D-heptose 1-phosphate adenosyltransferase